MRHDFEEIQLKNVRKSAKEKAKLYKDELISKSFYRFGYHKKVCIVLKHYFQGLSKIAK